MENMVNYIMTNCLSTYRNFNKYVIYKSQIANHHNFFSCEEILGDIILGYLITYR